MKIYTRQIPYRLVQAKTHKKRRVNKKWRNRYGMKRVPAPYDPLEVLRFGDAVYAYPEGIAAIEQAIANVNSEVISTPRHQQASTPAANQPVTLESIKAAMEELEAIAPPRPILPDFFAPLPIIKPDLETYPYLKRKIWT